MSTCFKVFTIITATVLVTCVVPTTKTTIDSKALKKGKPDVYEKYAKTSNVKASVRITVKD